MKDKKFKWDVKDENGDIEQRHHRFKRAVKQALMLRCSSEFESQKSYEEFLGDLLKELNKPRKEKLSEELAVMRDLPETRLEAVKYLNMKVRSGSTVQIDRNTYSVNSRLIGERIDVRLYSNRVEIWYGQKKQDEFPRLQGRGKIKIDYRHLIDSLVRKPGAFSNYRYREELFPTSRFRMAYDWMSRHSAAKSNSNYLQILQLAERRIRKQGG